MTEITMIPLSALVLSALNVRQTEKDADIAGLAEDIAARGLKTSINVVPAHFVSALPWPGEENDRFWEDRFEVAGGGRRTQAMRKLMDEGRLPADYPVPCMVEDRAEARETSLSENLHRVAMNPADEFEAFAAIVAQNGGGPDAVALCAKRFGVTQRHVEGRLRLASLAPELLEALRAGTIGVEAAKAYAGTTDHELQRKVFKAQGTGFKPHDPRAIREAVRERTLPISDPRLTFIDGLETYRANGGRTEVEMFMGTEGEERLVDVTLLEKLVAERAEAMLPAQAKADGFKSALFAQGIGWRLREPKAPKDFTSTYDYGGVAKAEKKQSIAVYAVSDDGTGLRYVRRFKPTEAQVEARTAYKPETEEERAARVHQMYLDTWSARLAVGPFAGTPLEGRAFWPNEYWRTVEWKYADDADEDAEPVGAYVSIKIRVTADQIAAAREAAEAKVAEIEAAEEAARLAREAAAPGDDDDQDDDASEFDDADLEDEGEATETGGMEPSGDISPVDQQDAA